jgi:hypothetical protein
MYTRIYQNSYIVLIITFIILCIIFYFFEIGSTAEIMSDGKIVRKFSWKYPLAISLVVWVFWHFYLYPPAEEMSIFLPTRQEHVSTPYNITKANRLMTQQINMVNWN